MSRFDNELDHNRRVNALARGRAEAREPAREGLATLHVHCVGAALLIVGGLLMFVATAARWGTDCVPGSFTSPECLQRAGPEYSFVVVWPMAESAVPAGVFMGLAMACCAVALVFLSRGRGRVTEVVCLAIGVLILGAVAFTFLAVFTATPLLENDRSPVGEWYRWNVLAAALPLLGLVAIAADYVMPAEPRDADLNSKAEREHRRWRLRMWIWLLLANPIVAYTVADALTLGRIRGLVPWTEAVTAAVVLAGGLTAMRSCLAKRAEVGVG